MLNAVSKASGSRDGKQSTVHWERSQSLYVHFTMSPACHEDFVTRKASRAMTCRRICSAVTPVDKHFNKRKGIKSNDVPQDLFWGKACASCHWCNIALRQLQ